MSKQSETLGRTQGIVNIRPKIINESDIVSDFSNREQKKIDELFKEYYKYKDYK